MTLSDYQLKIYLDNARKLSLDVNKVLNEENILTSIERTAITKLKSTAHSFKSFTDFWIKAGWKPSSDLLTVLKLLK